MSITYIVIAKTGIRINCMHYNSKIYKLNNNFLNYNAVREHHEQDKVANW